MSLYPHYFLTEFLPVIVEHTHVLSVNLDFPFDHTEKDLLVHFTIIIGIETGFGMIWSLVAMPFQKATDEFSQM